MHMVMYNCCSHHYGCLIIGCEALTIIVCSPIIIRYQGICTLYNKVQRFKQLGRADPVKIAKSNSKTRLEKTFQVILRYFLHISNKSMQIAVPVISLQINSTIHLRVSINAYFYVGFKSVRKLQN